MMKRLLSLLLTLAILLGAMPGLAETAVPVLHYADIASLKALAGDAQTGATWHEGMSPSASMNALQMWQWTDWFLSEKLRSLLGSAQGLHSVGLRPARQLPQHLGMGTARAGRSAYLL